jgi:hypothetical protein
VGYAVLVSIDGNLLSQRIRFRDAAAAGQPHGNYGNAIQNQVDVPPSLLHQMPPSSPLSMQHAKSDPDQLGNPTVGNIDPGSDRP